MDFIRTIFLCLISVFILNSCKGINYNYISQTISRPTDVDPLKGKWLIDKPVLNKLSENYEEIFILNFKNNLNEETQEVNYIQDFKNVISFNKTNTKTPEILELYKIQIDYDYLISTEFTLIENSTPKISYLPEKGLYRELEIKVFVYDLNTKKMIFEKEYRTAENIEIRYCLINIIDTKFEKFFAWTTEEIAKDFQNAKNWSPVF